MLKNLIEKAKSGLTEKPKKMRSKTVEVKSVHEENGSCSNKHFIMKRTTHKVILLFIVHLMIFIRIISRYLFRIIKFRLH